MTKTWPEATRRPRGFAAMSPEKQREIASKGGRSVPADKRSFAQNRDLAAAAGKVGGSNVPDDHRSFSQDRDKRRPRGAKAVCRSPPVRRRQPPEIAGVSGSGPTGGFAPFASRRTVEITTASAALFLSGW